jgi:hypothetical protein
MEVLQTARIKKDGFIFAIKLIQYYGGFIVSAAEEYGDVIWNTVELYFDNQTEAVNAFNEVMSLSKLSDSVKELSKLLTIDN